MLINPRSLHVRLCVWYALLSMAWMGTLGIFSYFYLSRALASSREATMQARETRLIRFVEEAQRRDPRFALPQVLHQYTLVNPDTDILEVTATDGTRIYPETHDAPLIPWVNEDCHSPRFGIETVGEHRFRTLQHIVNMNGREVRLLLAGRIDSHFYILRMMRNSYLISVPLMVLLSVAGGFVLSHHALKPVDRVTRAAHDISIRDLRHRLPVLNTGDEIQRLTETWNDVLARLQGAIEQLNQFTSDISHDLRTTVTVMLSTAQLALLRERTQQEYRAALGTIEQECEATSELLEDLLLAARSDVAEQNISWSPVNLSAVVEEACDHLRARMELKNQHLVTEPDTEAWILGDQSLLRRLVSILLDNAVKYTPEHGVITVSVCSCDHVVRLDVRDTGIGVAQDDVSRIFDRFYRADASRNRDQGGTGLGLSIAKWIAEAHRTRITLTSEPERGSLFSVGFPVCLKQNSGVPVYARTPPETRFSPDSSIEGRRQTRV